MAGTQAYPVFILLVIMLFSMFALTTAFSWRDDFNYQSVEELTSAGWAGASVNYTRLFNGSVLPYYSIVYQHFPPQLYDFCFEVRQMSIEGSVFGILTEMHNYTFTDYWSNPNGTISWGYVFSVDGVSKLTLATFSGPGQWHTLELQKTGRVFNLYVDGKLAGSYTETNLGYEADALVSVELSGQGWFDYVSVSSLIDQYQQWIFAILIGFIIVGALAAAVFIFWKAHIERVRRKRRNQKTALSDNMQASARVFAEPQFVKGAIDFMRVWQLLHLEGRNLEGLKGHCESCDASAYTRLSTKAGCARSE